jgi:maleate isomerase
MAPGNRARLGIICPAPTVMPEAEFPPLLPRGVSMCTTRIPLPEATREGLRASADHAFQAAQLLVQARVDVLGFLCTTGTLVLGPAYDGRFAEEMEQQTGTKTVTAAAAVVAALAHLGARKLVVATPYSQELNAMEREFLEYHGLELLAMEGMGLTNPDQIREVSPNAAYHFSRELWRPDADALFFSCTGVPTFQFIASLEQDIRKPVISSNQAALWGMLRAVGVNAPIAELGELFSTPQ